MSETKNTLARRLSRYAAVGAVALTLGASGTVLSSSEAAARPPANGYYPVTGRSISECQQRLMASQATLRNAGYTFQTIQGCTSLPGVDGVYYGYHIVMPRPQS